MDQKAPPPFTSQWPEGRSFPRMYDHNPAFQARFAMSLISFRESLVREAFLCDDETMARIGNLGFLIVYFSQRYPDFLEDPDIDERLVSYINELRAEREHD